MRTSSGSISWGAWPGTLCPPPFSSVFLLSLVLKRRKEEEGEVMVEVGEKEMACVRRRRTVMKVWEGV